MVRKMKKGNLIVIEGLDGSGKDTQTKILFRKLKKLGKNVHRLSFPDYKQPSSALARMYLNSEFGSSPNDVNAYAAASFFAVDRCASYLKTWKKIYQSGDIILSDRYTTSNAAYNLVKLPTKEWDYYLRWLEDYEYNKLGIPRPNLVIYLDMPPKVSQKFMTQRYKGNESKKDLHEKNLEFLKKCRGASIYASKKLNWKTISCSKGMEPRSIGSISYDILKLVQEVID